MIRKTKDWDQFIFRNDNRQVINHTHVKRLSESIKARNLLELRPILVNEKMEVIDGQHRLLAARFIGVEIFYEIQKKLDPMDIIRMNVSKAWVVGDYMNFFCQHEYEEYIKLKAFMEKHQISLRVALNITAGRNRALHEQFRAGTFLFDEDSLDLDLSVCWETIEYIKKMNGYSPFTSSSRFWKGLVKLVSHSHFDANKWKSNVHKMIEHFCPKARTEDYLSMFQTVYNWHNPLKIRLVEEHL